MKRNGECIFTYTIISFWEKIKSPYAPSPEPGSSGTPSFDCNFLTLPLPLTTNRLTEVVVSFIIEAGTFQSEALGDKLLVHHDAIEHNLVVARPT